GRTRADHGGGARVSRARRASGRMTARRRALQNRGAHGRASTVHHMPGSASLTTIRRRIDRIDDQLLRLLNRRARLVLAVGAHKQRERAAVYVPDRERAVLSRLAPGHGRPPPPPHRPPPLPA